MKTLHTTMKEMEGKKRVLEEAVDALNEEMSKVRAEGKLTLVVQPYSNILTPHHISGGQFRNFLHLEGKAIHSGTY
jgi:hypothetical protein